MTFEDLYKQVEFDLTPNAGSRYREAARRWLNLARSDIAAATQWKFALDPVATITTAAARTSGVYVLTTSANGGDCSVTVDYVATDFMFDESARGAVKHESLSSGQIIDPAKQVFGPPVLFADAGANTSGYRQVFFWPIPNDARTIRFGAYKLLTDVSASDDNAEVDPYFGPLAAWQSCFSAGIRYYADLNNNENAQQTFGQRGVFKKAIEMMKRRNNITPGGAIKLRNVKDTAPFTRGRLDPAHYNNRV